MASGSHLYTAEEVCDMIGEDGSDREYLFPGSDDDFGMSDEDMVYDPLDREQGK